MWNFDWDEQPELTIKSDLCVELEGFGLHAATHIQASDREGLEQLCRYIHRPPLASERLKLMEDGKIYYQFKKTWKDGRKGIYFEGADLIERLVALIPTPYKNIVRYHGAFAPRSILREWITRKAQSWEMIDRIPTFLEIDPTFSDIEDQCTPQPAKNINQVSQPSKVKRWYLWSELLRRVFEVDVQCCPHCGLRMQVISFIFDSLAINTLLPLIHKGDWVGLPRGSP